MEPIFFRGTPHAVRKRYFDGTHRIQSPEETWEQIKPLMRKIGVTRVANITGLDRVGIPVTAAIRPKSLTLAVASGKGLSLATALVSGLMESLETYCAEVADLPIITLSYNELIKRYQAPKPEHFFYRPHGLFHLDLPEKWVLGWDLIGQEEVAVPLASVIQNYRIDKKDNFELSAFRMDTNALASGCHFLEAVSSGIYEAIERDAVTCHMLLEQQRDRPLRKIKLDTIPYPRVVEALEKIERAEIQPILYDCTVDTEVPVFKAVIYDKLIRHMNGICLGYGAHLDPQVAMIRAITEAVQSRTVVIAGSRDDLFVAQHNSMRKNDDPEIIKLIENQSATVDASHYTSYAGETLEGDVQLLLEKLQKAGLSRVIVNDLSIKELGVSVVRVIIPGLEGYLARNYIPGERAQRFVMESGPINEKASDSRRAGTHLPAGAVL